MEDEKVSILALVRALYQRRGLVYKTTGVFVAIGLLIYFLTPREYTTTATLLSESSNSGVAGLSGLASLAGVNIGSASGTDNGLNSTLYEELLGSTPFLNKIANKEFYFSSVGKKMFLKEYFTTYSKPTIASVLTRLPSTVSSWFSTKKASTFAADTVDRELLFRNQVLGVKGPSLRAVRELKNRITYTLDTRTGLIELDLDLQDKAASASVMKAVIDELSYYVVNYETQKERRSLQFTEEQITKARKSYTDAQDRLASYRDRNRNILVNVSKAEDDRLAAQLNIEFNVYNSLLQQREQLKLKVANETPAISVMEPPQVPVAPSKPKLIIILVISLFLGFFMGTTFVLLKGAIIKITE